MSTRRLFVLKRQEQQETKKEMVLAEKVTLPLLSGVSANPDSKDNKPKVVKKPWQFTTRGSTISARA